MMFLLLVMTKTSILLTKNLIPSYEEAHTQECFRGLPAWYCCGHYLTSSTLIIPFYQEVALLSFHLEGPFLTVWLTWLSTSCNVTSFSPLSYTWSHLWRTCWRREKQTQALRSNQYGDVLCSVSSWEVQDIRTIYLFVVPSMCFHRLTCKTKRYRWAM